MPQQMYPVYETHLSVRTKMKELPMLRKCSRAARISELVTRLPEVIGRMNATSYSPNEAHLRLVGKIPPKTCKKRRKTLDRKSETHSYDELMYHIIQLAMEGKNDCPLDEYVPKHM